MMPTRALSFVIFAFLATLVSSFTVLPKTQATRSLQSACTAASPKSTTAQYMAGPAVLEPPTKDAETIDKSKKEESVKSDNKHKKGGWAVRLFNDPMNKREFVAMCLNKVAGLSDGQAYQVMMAAHKNGVSVVGRYDLERAELYRDSLRENGLTVDMIPVEDD
jgi:ATP-dependent Clp protease adapter protein ClpS